MQLLPFGSSQPRIFYAVVNTSQQEIMFQLTTISLLILAAILSIDANEQLDQFNEIKPEVSVLNVLRVMLDSFILILNLKFQFEIEKAPNNGVSVF